MSDTFWRRAEEIWQTRGVMYRAWFLLREFTGLVLVAIAQRLHAGTRGARSNLQPTTRRSEAVQAFVRDLRYAIRGLRKSPAFTVTAVATLAIGLGANTAIFTLLHRVVLNPLPYAEADRLVALRHTAPGVGASDLNQNPGTYFHYRSNNQTLEEMGLYQETPLNLTGDGEPQRIRVSLASASLFRTLRAAPALGRLYGDDEDLIGATPVTLLSHDLWATRYGSDSDIVGRKIFLNGTEVEVIGIMPAAFAFPSPAIDAWIPTFLDPSSNRSGSFSWDAIGRMRPNVSPEQVQNEFNSILQTLPERYPGFTRALLENSQQAAVIHSLRDYLVRGVHEVLWILLGSVGVLLAIACANVANLFLVRAEARQREVAVRTALGASAGARFRYHMAESLALGTLSAVLGAALAVIAVKALVNLGPQELPRLEEVRLDWQALLFCAGLAVVMALVFSILALLRTEKGQLHSVLREGISVTASRRRHRLRNFLVVSQVALALVLLISSGLMLRSFWQVQRINPGFDPTNVLTMRVSLPRSSYPNARSAAEFHQTALERIRALPGVVEAGVVSCLPLTGWCGGDPFVTADQPLEPGEITKIIAIKPASPGYFRALGIPLVAGRTFDRADHEQQTGVAIVSRALAERVWPGEDPIGKLATTGVDVTEPDWFTIVGVVESVRMSELTAEPAEVFYRPMVNRPGQASGNVYNVALAIRTSGSRLSMAGSVRDMIRSIDQDLPIANIRTMQRIVDESMVQTAFTMWLLVLAALFALMLGAVGLYGVISYVVGQRTNEIGVRMALGARTADVTRMVLLQAGFVVVAGVVVGLTTSFALTRLLRALLFNVSPTDLATYAGVTVLLLAVAGVAGYIPARRAASVDPANALRSN